MFGWLKKKEEQKSDGLERVNSAADEQFKASAEAIRKMKLVKIDRRFESRPVFEERRQAQA